MYLDEIFGDEVASRIAYKGEVKTTAPAESPRNIVIAGLKSMIEELERK
jgi:hypothetical protein